MYTKPDFAPLSQREVSALIRQNMFATLVSYGPGGLLASHLPFLLDCDRGSKGTLTSHLAAANPHAQLLAEGAETLVIFQGVHGYISSSWYPALPVRDSAPTWNFAVIHCRGKIATLDDRATARHLQELVVHMEHGRPQEWRLKELGPGGMERRLPNVMGFEIEITHLHAKFKMGQDERLPDTAAAIEELKNSNPALAETMLRYNARRVAPSEAASLSGSE